MTGSLYQSSPALPKSSLDTRSVSRQTISNQFAQEYPYLALIFGSLILWFIVVQVLYTVIDGPAVTTQNRAQNFALKMCMYGSYFLMILGALRLIQFARRIDNQSVISAFIDSCKENPWRPAIWLIHALLALTSYVMLMTNFMSVKTIIPEIIPFYFDETAHEIDKILFLGREPWTYFSWVYDSPKLVIAIDRVYTAWAGLIVGVWIYCFTTRAMPMRQRFQYIISMIFLWVFGGNVMATLLSSAGPCYYEYFTGSAVYQPLINHLAVIHENQYLGAYEYFDVLLTMYENKESRFAGISAAPSLHCASSVMFLFLFWKNKIARHLLIFFNIIIFSGSIILAWHYAIDGLIAIPLAYICWRLGGKTVRLIEYHLSKTKSLLH